MNRRRRYHNTNSYNYTYIDNGILLAEFRFFNKKKEFIKDKILLELRDKVKDSEDKYLYWTNDEFAKNHVGFKFHICSLSENDISSEVYIKILKFDNLIFTAEQFNKIKSIFDKKLFLSFEPDNKQKELLNNINFSNYKQKKIDNILKNWNEVVNFLIENKLLIDIKHNLNFDKTKNILSILFSNKIDLKEPRYYINNYERINLYQIIKVLEFRINNKNYRVLINCEIDYYKNDTFDFQVLDENDEDYIYADEGYIFLITRNDKKFYIDNSLKEYKTEIEENYAYDKDGCYVYNGNKEKVVTKKTITKLVIDMKIFHLMENNIEQIMSAGQKVITPNIYRFYKDRVNKDNNISYSFTEYEMNIINQYKKLLNDGREVKVDNTIISKTKIEIIGQSFKMEFDEQFLDVVDNFGNIKKLLSSDDVRYNFNRFYESLLKLSKLNILKIRHLKNNEYKDFKHAEFKINDMLITINKENKRIKINNIFSRINDVYHILSKIICYNNIDEFNKYIKDVSYIGVEWKKLISNGIQLELKNPITSSICESNDFTFGRMLMRFSLMWDPKTRTHIYLKLNDKKYLIKYKGKFKKYFNFPKRNLRLETLWKELKECLENIDDETILIIVDKAIEEAEVVLKRGKELVQLTINEVKAEETTIQINDCNIEGYKLKGRVTKSDYFIEKSDLTVYKLIHGKWNRRCVVDDHRKQRIFEDKLANRLVNIYNEPKKIFTLYNV